MKPNQVHPTHSDSGRLRVAFVLHSISRVPSDLSSTQSIVSVAESTTAPETVTAPEEEMRPGTAPEFSLSLSNLRASRAENWEVFLLSLLASLAPFHSHMLGLPLAWYSNTSTAGNVVVDT